jgi:hypothetical protein
MKRIDIEAWLTTHPTTIHRPARALLDACEAEVRHHAHELAWQHARERAEESLHRFEGGSGMPASEAFVAREVCHAIARDLKHHEPHVERMSEEEWLGRRILEALDPEARPILHDWLLELAEKEEHEVWQEIVSFTHQLARELVLDLEMTNALEWDFERSYPRLAARVLELVIQQFDAQARSAS